MPLRLSKTNVSMYYSQALPCNPAAAGFGDEIPLEAQLSEEALAVRG